ncbi:hypothetical protein GM3709_2354 [Geminocystis sp. NIES-3709]|nr:hypothetical protein GM3709_2354 [Geminocystis sp. NIES-3709]
MIPTTTFSIKTTIFNIKVMINTFRTFLRLSLAIINEELGIGN